MKIVVGADGYGHPLKEVVRQHLEARGEEVTDLGVSSADEDTPYYRTASEAAVRLSRGEFDRAVLVCGTGMGMAIIANKHPGVYAAVCETPFAAEKSRSINNSNVLTLGAMVTTGTIAADIVDAWLDTDFTEGWDGPIQEWLRGSMRDIAELEDGRFGEGEE